MICFERLKMVLFDFDDTLCIHQFHGTRNDKEYEHSMLQGKDYWSEHGAKPNIQMQKFLHLCKTEGKRISIISATDSYVHMTMKKKWVTANYQIDVENFSVGTWERKIEMMEDICEVYKYDPRELLIVDDANMTIRAAEDAGFQACSPMEVVNFINQRISEGRPKK